VGLKAARSDVGADPAPRSASAVIWHDLECGSYNADLALWRELADSASSASGSPALLDVGAGSGRVTLQLARAGHRVCAVDIDGELLGALRERTGDTAVETVKADARTLALERRDFALCIVPMQTIQLLGGEAGRLAFMRRARAHLRPGALLACAIVTDIDAFDAAAGDLAPSPEIALVDGTHYVSRATCVRVSRHSIRIERQRRILQAGAAHDSQRAAVQHDVVELDRVDSEQLEREGRKAGFQATGVRVIAATNEHVASEVVMLRA
jgi:SAM-dependent methyltransferase